LINRGLTELQKKLKVKIYYNKWNYRSILH
jgi:hypothetical protein